MSMINYLQPGEKPNPEVMLQRMSEWGKCLITGREDGLVPFPVDFNMGNVLASNMACLNKELLVTMTGTYRYALHDGAVKVEFETPPVFEPYNNAIFSALTSEEYEKKSGDEAYVQLANLFENYAKLHVKGIHSIELHGRCLTAQSFQDYVLRSLAKANRSSIITPNRGLHIP